MPESRRLGLALSGGGFRAAAFHLGVLKGLRQAGVLERIEVFSAVSGGALLAAAYMSGGREDFGAFEARMRRFLSRDLKLAVLVAALRPDRLVRLVADPGYSLTEVLAAVLDGQVLKGATLGSLRDVKPRLIVNATCVNHGTGWRFTPDRIGDWMLFTRDRDIVGAFPLSRAVAASAAFPGGFAPLVILRRPLFSAFSRPPREVLLTDGGVDDNLGVQALLSEECTDLVVSDGSFPFVLDDRPLDRFGLPPLRRLLGGVLLTAVVAWGAARLNAPAGLLLAAAGALGLVLALRLRFTLWLFGTVMMKGQRRGLLRRLFAPSSECRTVYLGLSTALATESEKRLRNAGVDIERLRRVRTDLVLSPAEVDGLVRLGEALVRERVSML